MYNYTYNICTIYIYTIEYYSRNEILVTLFTATWMDLKIVMQSGVNQTEKDNYHMLSLICGTLKRDTNELIYKT